MCNKNNQITCTCYEAKGIASYTQHCKIHGHNRKEIFAIQPEEGEEDFYCSIPNIYTPDHKALMWEEHKKKNGIKTI